jgi:hypothetical protein
VIDGDLSFVVSRSTNRDTCWAVKLRIRQSSDLRSDGWRDYVLRD